MALAERNQTLAANVVRLEKRLAIIEEVVQEQQDDPALHTKANTLPESYLQNALRKLQLAVKGQTFEQGNSSSFRLPQRSRQ